MHVQFHPVQHGSIAFAWSHDPCAQPLVVLHGLGDSAIQTYAPLFASSVLQSTPALFIDFPGFGEGKSHTPYSATLETMANQVLELLSHLHIQQAPMFAHSMGANVALILSQKQPERISPFLLAEPLLDSDQSVLAAGIAKFTEQMFVGRGYARLVRATSLQAHRGDSAATAFLAVLEQANPRIMHQSAVSLLKPRVPDFPEILSRVQQDAVVLIGNNSASDRVDKHVAGIRTIAIPNAGHFMFVEQSKATAYAILKLVDGMRYGGT